MKRRQVLNGLAVSLPFLAGCSSLLEKMDNTQQQTTTTTQAPPTTTTTTPIATPDPITMTSQIATKTATSTTTEPQVATINPAQLETYSSSVLGCSVKYPARWSVKKEPLQVTIAPPEGKMVMSIQSDDTKRKYDSVGKKIKYFKQIMRKSIDSITFVGQRSVTLPSGHPATVLDAQFRDLFFDNIPYHGTFCITYVGGRMYAVWFMSPKRIYPPNKQVIHTIVTSLTIT